MRRALHRRRRSHGRQVDRDRYCGPVAGLDNGRARPLLTNTTLAATLALERRYDRPPAARRADRRGPLLEGQDLRVDFVVLETERPKEVVLIRDGLKSTVSLGIEARGRRGKERERERRDATHVRTVRCPISLRSTMSRKWSWSSMTMSLPATLRLRSTSR